MKHVEFIDYTGRYPNLCSGILTLKIDNQIVTFGNRDVMFDCFWSSGGSCYFTNDFADAHVESGPWIIDIRDLPEKYRKYADEIAEEFNSNVPHGCCGGCI